MKAMDYFNFINSISTITISYNLKSSSLKDTVTMNQIGSNNNNVVITNTFTINQNILISVAVVSSLMVVLFVGILLYLKKKYLICARTLMN